MLKAPDGAWMLVSVAAALNWKFMTLVALCPMVTALKFELPRVNSEMLVAPSEV
jgi:hypothetical protein